MEETLYLLGSVSASLLLVGHGSWLLIRWRQRVRSRNQDRQLADQLAQLQQDLSTQLEAMRGYIGSALEDVHERLDSAEHILASGRGAPVDGKRY
jgi:CHASE3 domain sensor protein